MNNWGQFPELEQAEAEDFEFSGFAAIALRRLAAGIITGNTPIIVPRLKGLWDKHPRRHFHLAPEIFFQLSGGSRFDLPHQTIELLPGQILPVPAGLPHGETTFRHAGSNFANLVMWSAGDAPHLHLALADTAEPAPRIVQRRNYEEVPGIFALTEALDHPGDLRNSDRQAALRHLIAALIHKFLPALELPPAAPASPDGRRHPLVAQAMQHISASFPASIPNVKSVAAAGCSPNYLSGLFRRETGVRLTDYINSIRLEYARKMLRTTRHNVGEIAWSCGFLDAGYFNEIYFKRFGIHPSRERN